MPYRALRYVFTLDGGGVLPDAALSRVFAGLATDEEPTAAYAFREGVTLLWNGQPVLATTLTPGAAVDQLVQHVNMAAVGDAAGDLLLHAAALERDGTAVVLPGASGSGKSTLALELLRRTDLAYLTDETAAVEGTRTVPYAKPITLKPGAQARFPDLAYDDLPVGDNWQVAPWRVGGPAEIRLVVRPTYVPGAAVTVTPMSRAETALELGENTSYLTHMTAPLAAVAAVAEVARGYRMTFGDAAEAADAVAGLL
jgi:hypothetical protein